MEVNFEQQVKNEILSSGDDILIENMNIMFEKYPEVWDFIIKELTNYKSLAENEIYKNYNPYANYEFYDDFSYDYEKNNVETIATYKYITIGNVDMFKSILYNNYIDYNCKFNDFSENDIFKESNFSINYYIQQFIDFLIFDNHNITRNKLYIQRELIYEKINEIFFENDIHFNDINSSLLFQKLKNIDYNDSYLFEMIIRIILRDFYLLNFDIIKNNKSVNCLIELLENIKSLNFNEDINNDISSIIQECQNFNDELDMYKNGLLEKDEFDNDDEYEEFLKDMQEEFLIILNDNFILDC
jgi:hypothetical protein